MLLVSRHHRYTILEDELLPTWTTRHHDYAGQVKSMRRIRELSNGVARAYRKRDELMQALALSNSLSRKDMACAAGLNKSRVDQIIHELTEEDQRRKNREAEERVRRHMP
jgi:predicted transcriptional regulator